MTKKLEELVNKFRAFKDRIANESDILLQELQKYVSQCEFQESQGQNKEPIGTKLIDINIFKS